MRCKARYIETTVPLIFSCECRIRYYINSDFGAEIFKQPGCRHGRTYDEILKEIYSVICDTCGRPLTKMYIRPYFECLPCQKTFILSKNKTTHWK